jgi:hypothetical protein
MTTPNSHDPNKDENTTRFRTILSANEDEEPPKQTPPPARSILDNLPHAPKKAEAAPEANPPKRRDQVKPAAPPRPLKQDSDRPSGKRRFGPAFWTVTSILSLIVNAVLIALVLIMLGLVSRMNLKLTAVMQYTTLPETTVKGLYENFVKMDEAHIRTQIPVSAEIPVQFDIQINTQTEVVLSQDTPISQARVTLNTGGLNITNAPANIILPAGTRLPITLSLTVPVDKKVPVSMIVPVDIALSNTDLHEPFVGLQTVVLPLYCLLDAQATSPNGVLLCPVTPTP